MTQLHNCRHCGAMFLKHRSEYCSQCQVMYDHYYNVMRDHLRTFPRSSMMDLERSAKIPMTILQRLVKEEFVPFAR